MSSRAPLTTLSTLPLDRVTTTFELPGHRVVRNLGVVRGIVVRSRNIVGTFVAGLQTLFGGNITLWTEMCEQARRHQAGSDPIREEGSAPGGVDRGP